VDVDGNVYVDLMMGVGVHILGHGPEPVRKAIHEQLDILLSPTLPTISELTLAGTIQRHLPHLERLRFTNSGTEACMAALRMARAVTGRDKIAKFEGNYHGHHDGVLFSSLGNFSGTPDEPVPYVESAGLTSVSSDKVLMLPFNDLDRTAALIERHHDELAALIVEPVAGFATGAVPAEREFMAALRKLTSDYGIILVWDEVVTGFRFGLGGMDLRLGLRPDLTVLGKIIGGGLPIGAFGGSAELMEAAFGSDLSTDKRVFQSGTYTGHPLAMVAGQAVLNELEQTNPYPSLEAAGLALRDDLLEVASAAGFPVQVTGLGSMFQVHFSDFPIRSVRDTARTDLSLQRKFCLGLIERGVYLKPNHPGFLSTEHHEKERRIVVDTASAVFDNLRVN
jgi:glutamate-1-semialdehyde 2,1-aminomutase